MSEPHKRPHLRLMTYNIRKGKGASGRANMTRAIGSALPALGLDVLLCQEVFHDNHGAHDQSTLLSRALEMGAYYRPNKHRNVGHHGNAIFTAHHVQHLENFDISTNTIERRGALYLQMHLGHAVVHVFNAHLGLNHRQRVRQVEQLAEIIEKRVPPHAPLLLAGDFNDWNQRLDRVIVGDLKLTNAFSPDAFRSLRTWHARRPVFNLDRIYIRGLEATQATCLQGKPWNELSDHLPLVVDLQIKER